MSLQGHARPSQGNPKVLPTVLWPIGLAAMGVSLCCSGFQMYIVHLRLIATTPAAYVAVETTTYQIHVVLTNYLY